MRGQFRHGGNFYYSVCMTREKAHDWIDRVYKSCGNKGTGDENDPTIRGFIVMLADLDEPPCEETKEHKGWVIAKSPNNQTPVLDPDENGVPQDTGIRMNFRLTEGKPKPKG